MRTLNLLPASGLKKWFFVVTMFCLTASQQRIFAQSRDSLYREAIASYNAKKYDKALKYFDQARSNFPETGKNEDFRYYQALTFFRLKNYQASAFSLKALLDEFKASKRTEEYRFFIAFSHYLLLKDYKSDLDLSLITVSLLNDFIKDFPKSTYIKSAINYKNEIDINIDKHYYTNYLAANKKGDLDWASQQLQYVIKNRPLSSYIENMRYMNIKALVTPDLNASETTERKRLAQAKAEIIAYNKDYTVAEHKVQVKELQQAVNARLDKLHPLVASKDTNLMSWTANDVKSLP